jgi:O-antigen/teichoic acid export membrane protein
LFTPILVRIISQEQYGLYASVLAGFSILSLISKGGIFDASRKVVAENIDDSREISLIVSTSLLLSVAYGLVAVFLVISVLKLGLVPHPYATYAWILILALLFGNVFASVRGCFYGIKHEFVGEILTVSQRLLYMVSGLSLAYFGFDLIGVFFGYTISFIVVGFLGTAVLYRYSSYMIPPVEYITSQGKDLASFGGYQLIGGVSATLLYKTDIMLVEYFKGATSTALYNSAIVPAEMIWFLPSIIQLSFLQHTASLWADNKIEEINENIRGGVKYGVLSLTLFGVGLFVLATPFLSVYFGEEYIEASTTLKILIFGAFFFGVSRVITPVFQATGRIRQTEFLTVGALILNVLLNLILIPRYGIIGAGIGTTVSYMSIFIGSIAIWLHSQFETVSLFWVGRLAIIQILFACVFILLNSIITVPALISLIIFPPFGFVLFVWINVRAGYLSSTKIRTSLKPIIEW